MRTASVLTRSTYGALLAMLLLLRLLAPAGFMPSFDHGRVTIVACPDAGPGSNSMAGHHEGNSKQLHQHCPYAAASELSSLAADFAPLATILVLAVALLLGRTFLFLERSRAHERPPLRGPPLPA